MTVSLVWATPDADNLIADMARVSAPENQRHPETAARLIGYLIRNRHWSPFEMASMCVEIETTRDIGRQLLRHRSFSFQEFSQRYAAVDSLPAAPLREARMQHPTNRQASVACEDEWTEQTWMDGQQHVLMEALRVYRAALNRGIAKEVARAVLPEGLTSSRLYMAGTLRSWLHYVDLRMGHGTQAEHAEIASACLDVLRQVAPVTVYAFEGGRA